MNKKSTRKKTHEEFVNQMSLIFPDLEIIGQYQTNKKKILIKDNLGILYNTVPADLLGGHAPSILTAVSKTDCFVKKAIFIHKDKYTYNNTLYVGKNAKVNITCKKHGEFFQNAGDHLQGHGCQECANEFGSWRRSQWKLKGDNSPSFDNFKLYLVTIKEGDEEFFKIGITFRKIEDRLKNIKRHYNSVELIDYIIDNSDKIYNIEKYLKRQLKGYNYNPKKEFEGQYECFTMKAFDKVNLFFQL